MQAGKAIGPALIAGFAGVQVAFWNSGMAPAGFWKKADQKDAASIRVRVSGMSGQAAPATAKQ